jgi:hypothetical protein
MDSNAKVPPENRHNVFPGCKNLSETLTRYRGGLSQISMWNPPPAGRLKSLEGATETMLLTSIRRVFSRSISSSCPYPEVVGRRVGSGPSFGFCRIILQRMYLSLLDELDLEEQSSQSPLPRRACVSK